MEVPEIIFSKEQKKTLKIGNQEYFSANDFSLTETEIEKARIELRETEETKIRKLQELRDKLARDKEVNYRTDTPYLIRFLRVRKYDSDKAYQCIKDAYTFKKKFPETIHVPVNIEKLLNLNFGRYLPYTDENGNILFLLDVENWNLQETSVNDLIHIIDKKMNPWRIKNVLLVNTGPLSRLFYGMLRPFLSKKITDRVTLLGTDMKELHKYVNPELLPKKLGGSIDDHFSLTQNILDNISYIKYDNTFH